MFSLCFNIDTLNLENENVHDHETLWVGCRKGYILKLPGGRNNVDADLNITSLGLTSPQPIHDMGSMSNITRKSQEVPSTFVGEEEETDTALDTVGDDNVKNDMAVTCHQIIEWGLNKIIIVGYSNGELKIFDAPITTRHPLASTTCTFSLQLCKNAIVEITDIDLHEVKKNYDKHKTYDSSMDVDILNIEENGSFEWESANGMSRLFSENYNDIDKEALNAYEQTKSPKLNEEQNLRMTILISTGKTPRKEEKHHDGCHEEDSQSFNLNRQTLVLSLCGLKITRGRYTNKESPNESPMQMSKTASGYSDTYLSMNPIIVWSRLEKVVRYFDIPMLNANTTIESNPPICKALFFMSNQHQNQSVSELKSSGSNQLKEKVGKKEGKLGDLHEIKIVSILDNGKIQVYPSPTTKHPPQHPNYIEAECLTDYCVNVAAATHYPMNTDCFLMLCNEPNAEVSLSLKFLQYNFFAEKNIIQYLEMTDFIQDMYWPYENNFETKITPLVYITVVHLLKKCYAVIVFSAPPDAPNYTRTKSNIFAIEIPRPPESDDFLTSTKFSNFKNPDLVESRKFYCHRNMEVLDIVDDIKSCPPYYEEFFACSHESKRVSIWSVKGSQLKWIGPISNFGLPKSFPHFWSSYASSSVPTFYLSYVKQVEGGIFYVDIIDTFSGKTNIQPYLQAHTGIVGNIFSILIDNNTKMSSLFPCNTMENVTKRKWNTECQFENVKKRKIDVGCTKNKFFLTKQKDHFYSNVRNIPNEEVRKTEPDQCNIISISSFKDNKVSLWSYVSARTNDTTFDPSKSNTLKRSFYNDSVVPFHRFDDCHLHHYKEEKTFVNSKIVSVATVECKDKWLIPNHGLPGYNHSTPCTTGKKDVENDNICLESKRHLISNYDVQPDCSLSSRTNIKTKSNAASMKDPVNISQSKISCLDLQQTNRKKIISHLVFVLNESGRLAVTKLFLHEESLPNQVFKCDQDHNWEFAKQMQNKQEEDSSGKIATTTQYCLECCCSYTAMNNEEEKMRLLMLCRSNKKVEMKEGQDYNSGGNVYLEKTTIEKNKREYNKYVKDREGQKMVVNESLDLDQLLLENGKKKKMLQTIKGLGKMTSLSATHISSFKSSTRSLDNNINVHSSLMTTDTSEMSSLNRFNLHHSVSTEQCEEEKGNKSRNDHVQRQKAFISFDNDGCGHDSKYSFVIFVTTNSSSLQMYHSSSPSFIVWSYDTMMDETEKTPKNCYDDSGIFNQKGNTHKYDECVSRWDHVRITPIDVIPYGKHTNQEKTSQIYESHHRQPLALCSDIKILEKRWKQQGCSITSVTVNVILGLENGDVLEYIFDMSLIEGISHPSWVITSKPELSRKLRYSHTDRIVSLHYKMSNVLKADFSKRSQSSNQLGAWHVNENFVCTTLLDELGLHSKFEEDYQNSENVHSKLLQFISEDNVTLCQSIRSYNLKHFNDGRKLILYGSKEGTIYIFEASPIQEPPKYKLQKVGQYFCGTSSSEITSCAFIESALNDNKTLLPISEDNESRPNNISKLQLLGYIIAANSNGSIYQLKVLRRS